MWRVIHTFSLLFSIGPTVGAACPADAAPGSNWLVFSSFRGGDYASSLHATRPDGADECRISVHPSGRPNVLDPGVSADGKWVSFTRGGGGSHITSVWTMRADGSAERELASNVIRRFRQGWAAPVWSPDGRRIAFVADKGSTRVIRVMDRDGANVTELGPGYFPKWSPDGTTILFARPVDDDGTHAVWTMRADGSDPRRLTADGHSHYPSWSPDGKRIVFSRQVGEAYDLFTMAADGSNARALSKTPELSERQPAWSPDGKWIAFVAKPADSPDGWQRSVFVLPAAGGAPRQVTASKYNDLGPTWLVVPSAN